MKRKEAININYMVGMMIKIYQGNLLGGRKDVDENDNDKNSVTFRELKNLRNDIAVHLLKNIED
jgi:hypothetical protein